MRARAGHPSITYRLSVTYSLSASWRGRASLPYNVRMNKDQLRAMQAPLKNRYREEPTAAVVTLKAQGRLDDQNLVCKVDTAKGAVEAGLHPATGGDEGARQR